MKIEKIRKMYDTPDRKWGRESGREKHRKTVVLSFDEMLAEALAHREAIDIIDKVRK